LHKSWEAAVLEPIVLAADGVRGVVDVERGGRLASLVIHDREVLVTAANPDDRSIHWGSFLMAPWPGRLAGGQLAWRGRTVRLSRNHGRHAIHGCVFDRPWAVDRRDRQSCELSIELDRDRWPFGGRVRQWYALGVGRLEIGAEISTAGEPMPAALGWHPWFRRSIGLEDGNGVRLRLDAAGLLERRAMIPTGRVLPTHGRSDLSAGPALGRRRLDDAFVGVGRSPVIEWPELRLTLEIAPPLTVVTIYTPWNAVCIEPETAWPNALGLPAPAAEAAGVVTVRPGRPLGVAWSLRWD
jgi:aldose 1-epimerase